MPAFSLADLLAATLDYLLTHPLVLALIVLVAALVAARLVALAADRYEDARQAEARHLALGRFALAVRAAYSGGGTDPRLMAAATEAGTQVDSNLGFAVPMEVALGIEREMYTSGEILSRVDARTVSGNSIAYNIVAAEDRRAGAESVESQRVRWQTPAAKGGEWRTRRKELGAVVDISDRRK